MADKDTDRIISPQAYALAPMSVMLDADISHGAKLYYIYLDWRQGCNPTSWPSLERQATDLDASTMTIRRWQKELEDAGYLTILRAPGRVNHYALSHRIERYLQRVASDDGPAAPPRKGKGRATPNRNVTPTPNRNVTPPLTEMLHEHDHEHDQENKNNDTGRPPVAPGPVPSGSTSGGWAELTRTPHPAVAAPDAADPLRPDTSGTRELFSALARNATRVRAVKNGFANLSQRDLFLRAEVALGDELPHLIERAIAARGRALGAVVSYLDSCRQRIEKERSAAATSPAGRPDDTMIRPDDPKYAPGGRYGHLFARE